MLAFCRKLGYRLRRVNKSCEVYHETSRCLDTRRYKGRFEEKLVIAIGSKRMLQAEKFGRKLLVKVLVEYLPHGVREMKGTPFDVIVTPVTFPQFERFAAWFVAAGFYYKKITPRKPLPPSVPLSELRGLEIRGADKAWQHGYWS